MSDAPKQGSWWQTLPGVLTGTAAVITAVVGLLAFLDKQGAFRHRQPDEPVPAELPGGSAPTTSPAVLQTTNNALEARAGHYMFRVLSTKLEPYASGADGTSTKLLLRTMVRVTDVVGQADYIDSRTIRLAVDGAELMPTNGILGSIYDKQAVEAEALFVIPADARKVELLVGRPEDAMARIPLTLPAR